MYNTAVVDNTVLTADGCSFNKVREITMWACRGVTGQKPLYVLMTLIYQSFTTVLLTYGSLFLCDIYYCLGVFWCAAARMSELELEQSTSITFMLYLENVETKSVRS